MKDQITHAEAARLDRIRTRAGKLVEQLRALEERVYDIIGCTERERKDLTLTNDEIVNFLWDQGSRENFLKAIDVDVAPARRSAP